MAVTYDKIAYDEIELGLRKIINDEFKNVYIGNQFKNAWKWVHKD